MNIYSLIIGLAREKHLHNSSLKKHHNNTLACTVTLIEIGKTEFVSTGMAGAESGRRFKVVAYAELGSVAIAEEVAGDRLMSS